MWIKFIKEGRFWELSILEIAELDIPTFSLNVSIVMPAMLHLTFHSTPNRILVIFFKLNVEFLSVLCYNFSYAGTYWRCAYRK